MFSTQGPLSPHRRRARRPLLWPVVAAAMLTACHEAPPPTRLSLGGLVVRVWASPARIRIDAPDGSPLLEGLAGGEVAPGAPPHVAVAMRRSEATFENQFGAFWIEEREPSPWIGVTRFSDVTEDASGFGLMGAGGVTLGEGHIAEIADGVVAIDLTARDAGRGNRGGGAGANRLSVAFRCAPGEHFLGLGGQSWDVDHRGQTVPIWVQEDGISKESDDRRPDLWPLMGTRHSTHTPMPIYLSSRGYVLLLETPYRSIFSLCSEAEDVIRVEAWEGAVRLRVFYGPTPAEAIRRLTGYLGRPALPPAFAFAPWIDAIFGEDNVRRVAERLRAEGIPVSLVWTEDWRGGTADTFGYTLDEDWRLDRDLYPHFEQLAVDLHHLGYKLLVYNNTFLEEDVDVWPEASSQGYTIHDAQGDPYHFIDGKFRQSSLADLSNPAAWAWVQSVYREGLEAGADGYMADFAEWLPVDAVLASGEDAEGAHNLYPVEFQRLNRELFDEMSAADGVERLFFVRSAYLGSQPLVSVVWGGDQQTDFSLGDGLPSVIPIGIGLGVTGFPYYGHDIAGYMSQLTDPSDKELWFRWASLGALSPVMRTHHGKSAQDDWSWESDAETTDHFRRWATLHQRLFPYLYALARDAAETGIPMMRPFALHAPGWEPGWQLTDEFLLGDRIAVAPVLERDARSRLVELPEGAWYPLLGGAPLQMPGGGGQAQVDAPLTECPAFVPGGAILVLLPPGVESLVDEPTTDATLVTLADAGDDREVWLYPAAPAGGVAPPLVDAAVSSLTEVGGALTYSWDPGAVAPPLASVTLDGSPLEVAPDGSVVVRGNGTLRVNDAGTLTVTGGVPERLLRVRLLGEP